MLSFDSTNGLPKRPAQEDRKARAKALFDDLVTLSIQDVLKERRSDLLTDDELKWLDQHVVRLVRDAVEYQRHLDYSNEQTERFDDFLWRGSQMVRLLADWMTDAGFMKQVFGTMLLVAILGAGFTFQTLFADIPAPEPGFSKSYVQTCLAASWLLFVLRVATAAWCPVMVGIAGKTQGWTFSTRLVPANATIVFLLLDGAFLASAEAVRAYQNALGGVTLALLGLTTTFTLSVGLVAFTVVAWEASGPPD